MRDLLFLTQRIPYPPNKGDKIRAFHELQHLCRNYNVHLGCFFDDPDDEKYVTDLRKLCASVFCLPLNKTRALIRGLRGLASGHSLSEAYFHDRKMAEWVTKTIALKNIESVFVFCSAMAPYIMAHKGSPPVILDMVDVDSEKWASYASKASWPLNLLYEHERKQLLALERRSALTVRQSLFVSQAEAETFLRLAPECTARVSHLNNGVDLEYFHSARDLESPFSPEDKPLVFTGTMNYPPNVEAVTWFAEKVFPQIKKDHAAAEFWVVGHNPTPAVRRLERLPSIHVTGQVPDVRPYLKHSACIVVPVHLARGIQNKVLEAMAMGRPIVGTENACEGLNVTSGNELLIASNPKEFSDAVSEVLSGKHCFMGVKARARAEADHDWAMNLQGLDVILDKFSSKPAITRNQKAPLTILAASLAR